MRDAAAHHVPIDVLLLLCAYDADHAMPDSLQHTDADTRSLAGGEDPRHRQLNTSRYRFSGIAIRRRYDAQFQDTSTREWFLERLTPKALSSCVHLPPVASGIASQRLTHGAGVLTLHQFSLIPYCGYSQFIKGGRGMRSRAISRIRQVLLASCISLALSQPIGQAAPEPAAEMQRSPQQLVTLESLLHEAQQRSPGLKVKRRAYEAARARVFSAWLPDDPEIGTDVEGQSHLFRFDRTDNEYTLMQRIPFPTTLFLRGQLAAKEAQIAYQQYKEEERNTAWHVEQPYYELFLAKRMLGALQEIRALADQLSRAVQARYESNQAAQQDLLKARIESSKIAIELYQWNEKVHVAEVHLSHLLDQPPESTYALSEVSRSSAPELSAKDLEALALKARPELKAFEIGIARAKANRWLTASKWLPDMTGRIEARQFSGQGHIREYDTFLGLTIPVWSLIKGVGGEWKGAGRDVQAAEASYTEMKNEVLLAIHEAYSKVKTAEHGLLTYEQLILPQAKQQVEVALSAYQAGRADLLSLIDAQRMLKDAQIAYFRFMADYELGLSDLRLAVGGPLVTSGE